MFIAEIRLDHPELVLVPTIEAVPEMRIELENHLIADEGTYFLFFTVSGGEFDAFDEAIEADETVTDSTAIIDGDGFRVYRMRLRGLDRLVLPYAGKLGMHTLRAVGSAGAWQVTLQISEWSHFREFRSFCADRGVELTVDRLYEPDNPTEKFGLTPAQREVLVASYRAGYFEEPRQASLADVAGELGISSSATSGRLRRALATLLAETVVDDSTPEA